MFTFDRAVSEGRATQGDNQNGKGDFFTDLLRALLKNCSGKNLSARPPQPGLVFRRHALDAAYPTIGDDVEVLIETKVLGAPKNPRNPSQRNPLGRRGSSDLDKRLKEAGLKTIDLKAEGARRAGQGGGPTGDFVSWLRRCKPSCYLLLAVRVIGEADLALTLRQASAANMVMDGCGIVCYAPDKRGRYILQDVDTQLELDRVLSRICVQLRNLP